MRRPLPDQRFEHAHASISKVIGKRHATDYRRVAMDLPVLIQRNGLGQALTFLMVRKEKNPDVADTLAHLSDWIAARRQLLKSADILGSYIQASFEGARRAEHEAVEWAIAHKSIAEALLPK